MTELSLKDHTSSRRREEGDGQLRWREQLQQVATEGNCTTRATL